MIDCAVHLRWQDINKVWHQTDLYRHGTSVQLVDPPQGDEPLRFGFERKQHGFELRLYLLPDEPMRLETLWIELPHPVAEHSRVLVHGFQSWSENGVWSMQEGRKSLAPFYGPLMRRYGLDGFGDYRFIAYDDDAGEFHSHLFASIQQDSDEKASAFLDSDKIQDFFASTEEDLAYGVWRFREDAVVLERDVEGMVVLPGGHLGGVAQVLQTELDASLIPSVFRAVPDLGLCIAGAYCARGKLFDCMDEWKPQRVPSLQLYDAGTNRANGIDLGAAESGWTSWYLHYNKIDQGTILANLDSLKNTGAGNTYHQIDDGYQAAIGDWLRMSPGFEKGLGDVSRHVRETGSHAGIWIAPFLVSSKSEVFSEHPEWLARRRDHDTWLWDPAITAFRQSLDQGTPYDPGKGRLGRDEYESSLTTAPRQRKARVAARLPLWKGAIYALDILNPEVRTHLAHVLKAFSEEYGFALVKADFLFAAGLEAREGLTRAGLMSFALQLLRHWTAGTKLLLCGVPIGPAMGRGDYCRVGADVGNWDHPFLSRVRFQERVSTRNSLKDTALRSLLAGRGFKTDPDVSILRSHDTNLSMDEKNALWLVNQTLGQLQFTSDDPAKWLAAEKQRYLSQFPLRARKIVRWQMSADLLLADVQVEPAGQEYRLAVNWSDREHGISLYEGSSITARWWVPLRGEDKVSDSLWKSANAATLNLAPHSATLLVKLEAEPESDESCVVVWAGEHVFPGAGFGAKDLESLSQALAKNSDNVAVAVSSGSLGRGIPSGFDDLGIRIGAWAILKSSKGKT